MTESIGKSFALLFLRPSAVIFLWVSKIYLFFKSGSVAQQISPLSQYSGLELLGVPPDSISATSPNFTFFQVVLVCVVIIISFPRFTKAERLYGRIFCTCREESCRRSAPQQYHPHIQPSRSARIRRNTHCQEPRQGFPPRFFRPILPLLFFCLFLTYFELSPAIDFYRWLAII